MGDKVELVYDPTDPGTAAIHSDSARRGPTIIFTLVGLASLIVAAYLFFSSFQFARDAKRLSKE